MNQTLFSQNNYTPLAESLRPKTLNDVVGQQHLLHESGPLHKMIKQEQLCSLILWGPPGCGKTTLAKLMAREKYHFIGLSAIFSGISDLKDAFEKAKKRRLYGEETLLFVDEIHRFNRAQQDAFLPIIEEGVITLIGATTENPSFELNAALLSRCQVFELKMLSKDELDSLAKRAETYLQWSLPLTPSARNHLFKIADGDGRFLLNLIEQLKQHKLQKIVDLDEMAVLLQKKAPLYDKSHDQHFNLMSALHKSLRGSDVDAALYWFSRMLNGGEDPKYIARRLIRFASEDIGMADPQALIQALSGLEVYERLGSPEGELAISQSVVYLATAPKSNSLYSALKRSLNFAKDKGSFPPPKHILNAPNEFMKNHDYGKDYIYDHDTKEHFSGQSYFPENLPRESFYQPGSFGYEKEIQKRITYWEKLRKRKL